MNLLWLGGGLWIIPILIFGGALIFSAQTYLAWKSGATKFNRPVDGRTKIYKIAQFKYAVALWVIGIIVLLMMYSDR